MISLWVVTVNVNVFEQETTAILMWVGQITEI